MNSLRQFCARLSGLFFLTASLQAEPFAISPESSVQSVSGQFLVTANSVFSPLLHHPAVATDPDFIRLEPTFLAVTAERLKHSLAHTLHEERGEVWVGKIYLTLHPAKSLSEEPIIISQPFLQNWNCRVDLPDVTVRVKLTRSLIAALLLEKANRHLPASGKLAEIPSWLADGLAQEILANEGEKVVLTAPGKTETLIGPGKSTDDVPQTRINQLERGRDALLLARKSLQNTEVLTFDQLSWPTPVQLSGADAGAYRASAHLLVHSLLALKNGPEKMRQMISEFSHCENWQTAFYKSFQEDFLRPLDVEKWWTLCTVNFTARDPGPRLTPAASLEHLAVVLAVPVEIRNGSNSLPQHMEISMQTAIRSFESNEQISILPTKLRELELAKYRLAPDFAALSEKYRQVLADYLGEQKTLPPGTLVRPNSNRRQLGKTETIKKMHGLDARRRELEIQLRVETIRANLIRSKP